MKDLIDELEQATEGSRELDYRIAYGDAGPFLSEREAAPHYTTSLDAALMLVPEGMYWEARGGNKPRAGVYPVVLERIEDGATPALALCIAALKAREQADG